jgi:hypothetical protein
MQGCYVKHIKPNSIKGDDLRMKAVLKNECIIEKCYYNFKGEKLRFFG